MSDTEAILPSDDHKDESPSLDSKDTKDNDESKDVNVKIRRINRPFVLEPLIVLMSTSWYPLMLSGQLYTYQKFEEKVQRETGYNMSNANPNSTCDTDTNSSDYIFTQQVQKENAYFNMWLKVATNLPAFLSTLFLSPYSDRAGRKYAILPPVITGVVYALVYTIIIAANASVWFIIIPTFIESLGGSFMLLFVGMNSYMSDITKPGNLRFRLTLLYILMMAISSAGPVGFGYWINHSGFLWPCLFTVIMRALTVLYAIFLVPETIIAIKKPKFFTLQHVKEGIAVFTKTTDDPRRPSKLALLLLVFLLCYFGMSEMNVDTLFELNKPFCWDSVTIGYYTTIYMAVSAIGGLIMAKLMGLCASDLMTAVVGAVGSAVHYIVKGLVWTTLQLFLTCAFPMISVLLTPSIKTVMSKLVSSSEQGAVFGSLALAEIICGFAGGLLMNAIYANTLWILPGFVFIVSGMFYAMGAVVLIIYTIREKCYRSSYRPLEDVTSKE